jgi:phospholipid/cholesterol/gamma-HCH transport system permease protein
MMLAAERAGIGAVPIIALVGFLLGLILTFQSAIPMRQFGAQIFVADLLGISMLRELGPLMAAILLTARSGSAFAAELGTMKTKEEIDALTTMGLEPVQFLVVPRVLAAVAVVPALIMIMNLFGLIGGAVVFSSLGFPLVTFVNRIIEFVSMGDFLGGIFKGMVFGIVVAGVGCMRGLQASSGAGAVGESTTSSVVSGIVLIAFLDGIFAVVFYVLGI